MAEYGQTVTANEAERNRRIECRETRKMREGRKDTLSLYIYIYTLRGEELKCMKVKKKSRMMTEEEGRE